MDILNNANTIISLVVGLIGFSGSLYTAVSYLRRKASAIPKDTAGWSQSANTSPQPASVTFQPFSWLEWTEQLAGGMIDTADFLLGICFKDYDVDGEDTSILGRLGICFVLCLLIGGIIIFVLGLIIGGLLSGIGLPGASSAAYVIAFILLFGVLSFIYIYHVGRRIERKRKEQYQSLRRQQRVQQSQSVRQ
jgi:hypothetical protein